MTHYLLNHIPELLTVLVVLWVVSEKHEDGLS